MKKFFEEFKAFAMKGNVVDMAVGVIIGGAFGKIVSSLVADIITPLIGILTGNVDLSSLKIVLSEENAINYGAFIQSVISFLLIALAVFTLVKVISSIHLKKKEEPKPEPKPDPQIVLLTEIRDLLKEKETSENK